MPYQNLYPALDRCYRLGRYLLEHVMYEIGMWAGQDRILCALPPDAATIQADLGRRLCMDPRTLHRSLTYLRDKAHYVKYSESPSDMRISRITMTRHGVKAAETVRHTYGLIAVQMCVGLSATEVAELNRLLEIAVRREAVLRARKLELREVLDGGHF